MEAKPILSIRNLIEATIDREPKPRSRHLKHNIPNVVRQWNALTCVRRQQSRNSSPMESEITKEEEDHNRQQQEIEEEDDEDDLSDVGEGCSSVISEVVSSVNNNNNNTNNNGGRDDDNKVKNNTNHFIMKRFLPAAQAMATPSHPTSQRPPIPKPQRRRSAPLLQRKVSRARLPRQSRPILFRKGFDEQEEEEKEEEEESNRLFNFKMACVGLFSHRLKNVLGNSPKGSCWSSRNHTKSPRSSFRETEGEEDTSSGAEDERVVIAATKRRALEVKARKAYSSQNAASQSSMSTPSPSPMRWNKEFSSAEIGQVLLNKIRQHNSAFSGSAFSPQPQPHPRTWVKEENKEIQKMNMNDKSEEEEEEEVWFSGNSSSLEEEEEEGSEFGERDSSPVSVLLLQPPLPKSPTESWLWRSLPSLNTPSPYQPILLQQKAYHGNIHNR